MKILFQPDLKMKSEKLSTFIPPEEREIKLNNKPGIAEKIFLGGNLYEVVDIHNNCPGIVVFVK